MPGQPTEPHNASGETQDILRLYFRFVAQLHKRITSDPAAIKRVSILTDNRDLSKIEDGRSLTINDTDV